MLALRSFGAILVLAALLPLAAGAAPLDPADFTPLGTLALATGAYTIDTDALTIVDDAAPGTPLFTGVIDDQDGLADSYGPGGAVTTVGPAGIPHVAVFAFDDVSIAAAVSLTVTGHRALALVSRGDAVIDADLDLSGQSSDGGPSATRAGPGGFDGGARDNPGAGPGGGGLFSCAGHAQPAHTGLGSNPNPGVAYGDLKGAIQGGSGGGGGGDGVSGPGFGEIPGGAGGGALEIAVAGALQIGGTVDVRGGAAGAGVGSPPYQSGGGSGGSVRVTAPLGLALTGSIQAGSPPFVSCGASAGRVYVGAGVLIHPDTFSLDTSSIDLSAAVGLYGVLTVRPFSTLVPQGESLELGGATFTPATSSAPALETVAGAVDLIGGDATLPAGGITLTEDLTSRSLPSTISGAPGDVLTLASDFVGTATFDVPLVVTGAGTVTAGAGEVLALSETVTNQGRFAVLGGGLETTAAFTNGASGRLAAIDATLGLPGDGVANDDGLVNLGALDLIDATVDGDVRSPAGSNVNVAGTATFNGLFSGAGTFSGTTNLVVFNGGYSPGDSPAAVDFDGDVAFTGANTLTLEIEGPSPGTGHDQVNVAGAVQLGGAVALTAPLTLTAGDEFTLLTWGSRTGEFASVAGVQQPDDLDLALRYDAGALVGRAVVRGDVDFDGDVDAADLAIVDANLGAATTSYALGDVDGSGTVDAADRSIVEMFAVGASVPALGAGAAAVLAVALLAAAFRLHPPSPRST